MGISPVDEKDGAPVMIPTTPNPRTAYARQELLFGLENVAGLDSLRVLVLLYISKKEQEGKRYARISNADIAVRTKMSMTSVTVCIRDLVEMGLISRELHHGDPRKTRRTCIEWGRVSELQLNQDERILLMNKALESKSGRASKAKTPKTPTPKALQSAPTKAVLPEPDLGPERSRDTCPSPVLTTRPNAQVSDVQAILSLLKSTFSSHATVQHKDVDRILADAIHKCIALAGSEETGLAVIRSGCTEPTWAADRVRLQTCRKLGGLLLTLFPHWLEDYRDKTSLFEQALTNLRRREPLKLTATSRDLIPKFEAWLRTKLGHDLLAYHCDTSENGFVTSVELSETLYEDDSTDYESPNYYDIDDPNDDIDDPHEGSHSLRSQNHTYANETYDTYGQDFF